MTRHRIAIVAVCAVLGAVAILTGTRSPGTGKSISKRPPAPAIPVPAQATEPPPKPAAAPAEPPKAPTPVPPSLPPAAVVENEKALADLKQELIGVRKEMHEQRVAADAAAAAKVQEHSAAIDGLKAEVSKATRERDEALAKAAADERLAKNLEAVRGRTFILNP